MDNDLVMVLETNDQIQLAMAKGLLEDSGIPVLLTGQISTFMQEIDGLLRKVVGIRVPRDRFAEAQELLRQFHTPILEQRHPPASE
ncbi:MAG TPA: DUF2007 domain-containing protein [Bryobacteraceae bacterium]|jgi:hypothetical protein